MENSLAELAAYREEDKNRDWAKIKPNKNLVLKDTPYCLMNTKVTVQETCVVATKDIKAGEPIIAEEPTVSFKRPVDSLKSSTIQAINGVLLLLSANTPESLKVYERLQTLYPRTKEHVAAINKSFHKTQIVDPNHFPHLLQLRIIYNQFSCTAGLVTFIKCSKFNHACVPNCHFVTLDKDNRDLTKALERVPKSDHAKTLVVRAARSIAKGEELTISYGAEFYNDRALRQAEILSKHLFVCTCTFCVAQAAYPRGPIHTLSDSASKTPFDSWETVRRDERPVDMLLPCANCGGNKNIKYDEDVKSLQSEEQINMQQMLAPKPYGCLRGCGRFIYCSSECRSDDVWHACATK